MQSPALISLAVNIYDVQANLEGAARLITIAIAIGVCVLVADKFCAGKKWW